MSYQVEDTFEEVEVGEEILWNGRTWFVRDKNDNVAELASDEAELAEDHLSREEMNEMFNSHDIPFEVQK